MILSEKNDRIAIPTLLWFLARHISRILKRYMKISILVGNMLSKTDEYFALVACSRYKIERRSL